MVRNGSSRVGMSSLVFDMPAKVYVRGTFMRYRDLKLHTFLVHVAELGMSKRDALER